MFPILVMMFRKYNIRSIRICLLLLALLPATWKSAAQTGDHGRMLGGLLPVIRDTADIRQLLKVNMYRQGGHSDTSVMIYRHLLKESQRLKYPLGAAASLIGLNNLYSNMGRPEEAHKVALEAIAQAQGDSKARKLLATAYNNAGRAAMDMGDPREAADLYLKAAETIEHIPGSVMPAGTVYSNIGTVLENDSMKLFYFGKAEAFYRHAKDTPGLGLALLNKAFAYEQLKDWARSDGSLQEVLDIGYLSGDTLLQRRALMKMGVNRLGRHLPREALQFFDDAERAGQDMMTYFNIVPGFSRSEAYTQLRNYGKAEQYARQALDQATQHGFPELVSEGHRILSDIYGASGRFEQAYQEFLQYHKLNDSLKGRDISRSILQLQARYESSRKDKALAEQQLEIDRQQRGLARSRIVTISVIGGALLLSCVFFLVYRNYSNRQRLLLKDQELVRLKAMIKGEEKERGRIARELHDGIGGMLVAINMNLGMIRKAHPDAGLDRIEHMLDDAGREVRKTAHNLVPDVLERHNLREALALYCAKINDGGILQVLLQCDDSLPALDPITALILYRIIQELVQNIVKHAGATQAGIYILPYEDKLAITIEDNGKGFDPEAVSNGTGLHNVRHRVHALQGELHIAASPGRGTTIHIELLQQNLSAVPV